MRFDYPSDLYFECIKCGLCCGDTPIKTRHVLLLESEAKRIAATTNQPIGSFTKEKPQKAPYAYEINKNPANGKCVFLQNNLCTIYAQRPLICRFYPFELSTSSNGTYKFKATNECPEVFVQSNCAAKSKLNERFFRDLLELARFELNNSYL